LPLSGYLLWVHILCENIKKLLPGLYPLTPSSFKVKNE
jgi:hypothetical protein